MKKKNYIELTALKGKMREEKITYRVLAKDIEMSLNALNSKVNGHTAFTLTEATKIIDKLDISPNDVAKYFFPTMLRNATMTKVN